VAEEALFPNEKPVKEVVAEGVVMVILGFSVEVVEASLPNLISVVLEDGFVLPKVKDGAFVSDIKVLSLSELVDKVEVFAPNENVGAIEVFSFSKGFSASVGLLIEVVKVNPTVVVDFFSSLSFFSTTLLLPKVNDDFGVAVVVVVVSLVVDGRLNWNPEVGLSEVVVEEVKDEENKPFLVGGSFDFSASVVLVVFGKLNTGAVFFCSSTSVVFVVVEVKEVLVVAEVLPKLNVKPLEVVFSF